MQARLALRTEGNATSQARDFIAAFAAEHGLDDADRARLLIVADELLTNVMKYGRAEGMPVLEAELMLSLEGDRLTLVFSDDGTAFDPLAEPPPELDRPLEARPIGRLGLHIVRELADEVCYSRTGGRNVLRLSRRVVLRRPG